MPRLARAPARVAAPPAAAAQVLTKRKTNKTKKINRLQKWYAEEHLQQIFATGALLFCGGIFILP